MSAARTFDEWAARWKLRPEKALEFLDAFERAGLAERVDDVRWRATEAARDLWPVGR